MNGDIEDPELGSPIAQLAQLSEEPPRGFLDRIRGNIERRRLGSQMTGLAWHGVALVIIELLTMVMSLLGSDARRSDDDNPTV